MALARDIKVIISTSGCAMWQAISVEGKKWIEDRKISSTVLSHEETHDFEEEAKSSNLKLEYYYF